MGKSPDFQSLCRRFVAESAWPRSPEDQVNLLMADRVGLLMADRVNLLMEDRQAGSPFVRVAFRGVWPYIARP